MTRNHGKRWQRPRSMAARMRGLTLIELMIAVALGLGVMSGIVVLYVDVNETASYLNAASRVQENGRFAIDQIVRTMRMAGYDDPAATGTAAPVIQMQGLSPDSVTISGFTVRTTSDAISVSHEGAPLVRDCRGRPVAAHEWVANTFAISSNSELICNTVTLSGGVGTVADGRIIAEGVEDMVILYGVDSDADGVANRYYPYAGISSWSSVVSAKVALLVNSVEPVYASTMHTCESCSTFNPTANDLMRGEFHATIRFRNSLDTSS